MGFMMVVPRACQGQRKGRSGVRPKAAHLRGGKVPLELEDVRCQSVMVRRGWACSVHGAGLLSQLRSSTGESLKSMRALVIGWSEAEQEGVESPWSGGLMGNIGSG